MLRKYLFILICLLISKITIACSCNQPNIFLEFYSSKYVFEGEVISKTYPKDSLTYTFTFKINKHFKDGDKPDSLSFTWQSEAKYIGVATSCDYNVDVGEKYLVFAQLREGKLVFGIYCSNSSRYPVTKRQIDIFENAKHFNPLKYHFNYDYSVFNKKPPFSLTDIDSIIKPYKEKRYLKENNQLSTIIMFDVDTNGNVTETNFFITSNTEPESKDSLFRFFNILNKEYKNPQNDYEADALAIAKKIKKWEVMRFNCDNKPVNARHYITFSIDKNNQINWNKVVITMN
jgi:hypothetical protein